MKKLIIVLISTAIIFLFAFKHEYVSNEVSNKENNFISYKNLDNVISDYLKKDYTNKSSFNPNKIFLSYDIIGTEIKDNSLLAYITYSLAGYEVKKNIAKKISNENFNGVISVSKDNNKFIVTNLKSIPHNQDIKNVFPKKYIFKAKINPKLKHSELIKEKVHAWRNKNKITFE